MRAETLYMPNVGGQIRTLSCPARQNARTSKSIVQVSLACGFSSAAHFSNAYRERFGVTPREERRNWIAKQHGAGVAYAGEPRAGALIEPPDRA